MKYIDVINYWMTNVFFEQEKAKIDFEQEKAKIDEKKNVFPLPLNNNEIMDAIYEKARQKKDGMKCLSSTALFIDTVDRRECLSQFREICEIADDEVEEKTSDEIWCAYLVMDREGYLRRGSLKISPIVWAIKNTKSLKSSVSVKKYKEDCQKLEELLFPASDKEPELKPTVTPDKLSEMSLYIKRHYLGDINQKITYGFSNAYYEDNPKPFTMDFYTEELSNLKKYIPSSKSNMTSAIVRYIEQISDSDRRECINADSDNQVEYKNYKDYLNGFTKTELLPMGKWPDGHTTALMQQIAVNTMNSGYIERNPIFSVNGPPGTGKTTLVREIVADCIVKRAELLSSYRNPDEAFRKEELNGSARMNNFYYKLKDNNLKKYGILVVSNNNAAVENITNELPLSEDIANACKKYGIDPTTLFFSDEAKRLFESDKAWGLIAAPLGNGRNIGRFRKALESFFNTPGNSEDKLKDFRKSVSEFKNTLKRYEELKTTVSGLNNQLSELQDKIKINKQAREELCNVLAVKHDELCTSEKIAEYTRVENNRRIAEIEECMKNLRERLAEYNEYQKTSHEIIDSYKTNEGKYLENILHEKKIRDVTGIRRIFPSVRNAARGAAIAVERYEKEFNKIKEQYQKFCEAILSVQSSIKDCVSQEKEYRKRKKTLITEISDKDNRLEQTRTEYNELSRQLVEIGDLISNLENNLLSMTRMCCQEFIDGIPNPNYVLRITDEYISDLQSFNPEISANAHSLNPNTCKALDELREELFLRALKVQSSFVSASVCVKTNLSHYYSMNNRGFYPDGSYAKFSDVEKVGMMDDMYQSLFLFVPVISSTFASVHRMFGDIMNENTIGTLVVDEAGQAEPYMALGALFRSKRAIIVGDPNQLEPVITDDLNLIKQIFPDEYKLYKNASASVQSFAGCINRYGTLQNDQWLGSPLVIHRRCISPMFDISNALSYNNIMKNKTNMPENMNFFSDSCWIDIGGQEKNTKNHFVREQAEKTLEILESAVERETITDMFVITPFTTVQHGFVDFLKNSNLSEICNKAWCENHVGTVHTFQGKEAREVIFLLGCDNKSKEAVRWVNKHLVNVAVTRAKYRLYVIGDKTLWSINPNLELVQNKIG